MQQQETGNPIETITNELVKILRRLPEDELKEILKQAEDEVAMAAKFIIACEKAAMLAVNSDEERPVISIRESVASQFSLEELTVADKGLKYLQQQLPQLRMMLIVVKNMIVRRG